MSFDFQSPDARDRNAGVSTGQKQAIGQNYTTKNGAVYLVTTYSDGTQSMAPMSAEDVAVATARTAGLPRPLGIGATIRGQDISAANAAAERAQQNQQFQSNQDMERAKFNISQQFNEAQQKWREAVDARDAQAADYWKARTYELQRNQQTMDYTKQLQSMSGPQDYVKYWYASRGMTTPRGAESVRYEDAIPTWAQPVGYGSDAGALGQAARAQAAVPTWAKPTNAAPAAAPGPTQTGPGGTQYPMQAYADPAQQAARVKAALGPGVAWGVGNLGGGGFSGSMGGGTPVQPGQTEDPDYQRFRQGIANAAIGGTVSSGQLSSGPVAVGPNGIPIWARG